MLKPVLLLQEQLKGHSEILVNEETSFEDSNSEKNSEYQISDNESSDGKEEYIREHNLKVYANKIEQKKISTLAEIEKVLKPVIRKFNAAELNYSTGDKEVLALIKSIKGVEAFLGNKSVVRIDNKRVKNFKNYKLTDAADRGRVLRWQMFLTQYEYDVEMVAGDKNYLHDALTREMTMFEREGHNPRSWKPVSEEKKLWERYKSGDKIVGPLHDGPGYQYIVSYGAESSQPSERIKPKLDQGWDEFSDHSKKDADQSVTSDEEKLAQEFLLCSKGTASTDWSQGKRPASPSQTADGKDISSPFMAADLPKSRNVSFKATKSLFVLERRLFMTSL
ncbi:hypothetical protein ACLB2K_034165 [Fragaria x ananassa]